MCTKYLSQYKLANRHSMETEIEKRFSGMQLSVRVKSCDTLSVSYDRHVESTGSGEKRAGIRHRGDPGEVSARH